MKTTAKKILLTLSAVMLFVVVFCFNASALEATGKCGDNITWNFNEATGELVISGTGKMYDYDSNYSPFYYEKVIKSVVVNSGVTDIGNSMFYGCSNIELVKILNGVVRIGKYAFADCFAIKEITLPNTLKKIDDNAFYRCPGDKIVNYDGSKSDWESIDICEGNSFIFYVVHFGEHQYAEKWVYDDGGIHRRYCKINSCSNSISQPCEWEDFIFEENSGCYQHFYSGVKCSICGFVSNVKVETFVWHTYQPSEKVNVVEPTCTTYGSYDEVVYCSKCNTEISKKQYLVEPIKHTENLILGKSATCTEKGLTAGKQCTTCGTTTIEQTEIPALGHREQIIGGKNPTCTETGLTDGKRCIICGTATVAQTEIPALGHKEETIIGKPATCTETGLTEGKKCSTCGLVTVSQTSIPATGHTEQTIKGKAATCTKTGLTDGKKCSACGIIIIPQIEIPIEGHNYEETYVEPTCIKDGYLKYVCVDCGDTEQNELTATGHTETTLKAVKPTYTKTGLTEGKKCKTCGKVTVKQKKVAKKKLKKVTISSVKSTKKKTALVGWKKVTDASGYIVEYSTSKKFTKKTTKTVKIKKGKTTKTTLKKLKSGKKYYVRIRAYKTVSKKTVYGSYSSVKTVKIK